VNGVDLPDVLTLCWLAGAVADFAWTVVQDHRHPEARSIITDHETRFWPTMIVGSLLWPAIMVIYVGGFHRRSE